LTVFAAIGGIIVSSILGAEDRTDIEGLARRLFLNPSLGLDPGDSKKLARVPAVRSAIERAAKLNAPKQAVLDRLTACEKTIPNGAGSLPRDFYAGFPRRLRQVDPGWYGPWCYQPITCYGDIAETARIKAKKLSKAWTVYLLEELNQRCAERLEQNGGPGRAAANSFEFDQQEAE
jgi:hypothetical protein